MQSGEDLLSSLYQRGVKLWTENGQLRFQAPRGTLFPEELNKLRTLKVEIIELLEQPEFATDVPLQPRVAGCPVPLTALQLRGWNYINERATGLSERMCIVAMRVVGLLNADLLRRSLEAVVRRHESLRTRIVVVDGVPTQQIDAACEYQLEVIDLLEVSPINAEREVLRLGEEFVKEKVDLSVGPLFAAKLFRLSNREHVLILALDHMITDGVSNTILSREIWTLYHQAAQGLPFSLPKLPLQFADYAVWQQRTYGAWLKKHEAYWKGRLTGAPRIQLPLDDGLAEVKHPIGAMLKIPFGNTLSIRLRDVARRERTLLAVVVLAIYVAVMSRWCNQRDLVLMFVSNARYRQELQNMIGFLANFLHLRIEVTKEDSFLALLKRVNLEFRSAYEHQDFGRVPDFIPECTTELRFNWLPTHWAQGAVDHQREVDDAVRIQPFPLEVTWPLKFATWFSDTAAGVGVTVVYRPDLFATSTMERFGHNLRLFAEEFSQHPHARVASISMR